MAHGDTTVESTLKPIGTGAFGAGILAGTLIAAALLLLDVIGRGDPNAGNLLFLVVAGFPVFWLYTCLIGWLPVQALRTVTPGDRLTRLAFVVLVLASVISIVWLVASQWIDGFFDSPYIHSVRPPFADRVAAAATQHWRLLLFVDFWGGLACWGVDQRSCWFSEDRSLRLKARFTLAAVIAAVTLPAFLFLTCNQYVVAHQAREIASARPYCILVSTHDDRLYVVATRRWQLSAFRMRASYVLTSGSIGGFYLTNHALLVLDDPREYRNWSYRSENFETEPLINLHGLDKTGKPRMDFEPCVPERDFIAKLG